MSPEETVQTPEATPTPTPTPEPSLINQEGDKSLINQDVKPAPAPEKYADFKLPDGYELDKGVLDEAAPLFKEMNLNQDQAQKLVDLYSKHALATQEESSKLWRETREAWMNQVRQDPEIGGKLDQVRTSVARMIDSNLDSTTAAAFREAMDYTGAGNNPAFIKALWALSQRLGEGSHVAGNGPVEVRRSGTTGRPSIADALYPGGPVSGRRVGPAEG